MSLPLIVAILTAIVIVWLFAYMRAQRPVSNVQQLIQQNRYEDAVAAANRLLASSSDSSAYLHRAEALKLMGHFDDAIESFRRSDDPAAKEGIALCLAHLGRDLDEARRLVESNIALHPQIQEFQALELAYVLLSSGDRDAALRVYRDNAELLETRFRDDYTDADPMLAETLWIFAELAAADGDAAAAAALRARAAQWAPGSVWARPGQLASF